VRSESAEGSGALFFSQFPFLGGLFSGFLILWRGRFAGELSGRPSGHFSLSHIFSDPSCLFSPSANGFCRGWFFEEGALVRSNLVFSFDFLPETLPFPKPFSF